MAKFKFKPSKNIDGGCPGTCANGERAERSEKAIREAFSIPAKDTLEDCNATDLISDALHLCDKNGWDVEKVIQTARDNWQDER